MAAPRCCSYSSQSPSCGRVGSVSKFCVLIVVLLCRNVLRRPSQLHFSHFFCHVVKRVSSSVSCYPHHPSPSFHALRRWELKLMGSPDWCAWLFTESPQPGAASFSLKPEVVWYEEASRVDVCFQQEREGEHLVLRLNLAYGKKDRAPADRRQISSWNSAQTGASKHLPSSPSTVVSFLQPFLGNSLVLFNQSKCL